MRDFISWMHDIITLFTVDEQANSMSQSESMIAKHNEHKVIILIGIILIIHDLLCTFIYICIYIFLWYPCM